MTIGQGSFHIERHTTPFKLVGEEHYSRVLLEAVALPHPDPFDAHGAVLRIVYDDQILFEIPVAESRARYSRLIRGDGNAPPPPRHSGPVLDTEQHWYSITEVAAAWQSAQQTLLLPAPFLVREKMTLEITADGHEIPIQIAYFRSKNRSLLFHFGRWLAKG